MYKLSSALGRLALSTLFCSGALVAQGAEGIPVVRSQHDRVIIVQDDGVKKKPAPGVDVEVSMPNETQVSGSVAEIGDERVEKARDMRLLAASSSERGEPIEAIKPGAASDEGQRFWELYHQLQTLSEEVRQLRGVIEVSENLMHQLDKRQARNYVDLDERLMRLESQNGKKVSALPGKPNGVVAVSSQDVPLVGDQSAQKATAVRTPVQAVLQTVDSAGAKENAESVPEGSEVDAMTQGDTDASALGTEMTQLPKAEGEGVGERLSEKAAYDKVYASLERRDFDAAREGFQAFVKDYPKGQLRGNALYWLAELSLRQKTPEEEMALNYIEQLINQYPDHVRIPDALYKQATLKYRRNDIEAASSIYSQIVEKHPNTTAARLADHQLRRLGGALE